LVPKVKKKRKNEIKTQKNEIKTQKNGIKTQKREKSTRIDRETSGVGEGIGGFAAEGSKPTISDTTERGRAGCSRAKTKTYGYR